MKASRAMRQSHRPLSGRESKRRPSTARRARAGHVFAPGVERLEARELLANGFLHGVVYHDFNNNGVLDASDPRLAGSTVRVFQGQTQVRQTVTGADGYYLFTDLPPNNYR